MKNAMFALLTGIALTGLFPLAAAAVPEGMAHDGFGGRAGAIESAQIPPQQGPDDFAPFPMGGEKEGCMETCSVKDGGYHGGGNVEDTPADDGAGKKGGEVEDSGTEE